MSFSNYTNLQTVIQGFLFGRSDIASSIPDFITLAEAQMNRVLDCRQMQQVSTFTISGETHSVPDDFAGVKSFRLQTSPTTPLKYVEPDAFDDAADAAWDTTPYYYTIVGEQFLFSPAVSTSSTARLRYRAKIPALATSNPTNWLLDSHPDAYLYGSLLQSAPWLVEDERIATWSSLFTQILSDINTDAMKQAYGSSLQTRSGIRDG